jgi:hypothetical protein
MAYTRNPNAVLAGRALRQNPSPTPLTPAGAIPVTLDAVVATTTSLGVVQIGANINITPEGVISVSSSTGCCCRSTLITGDYTAKLSDYYIGVSLAKDDRDDRDDRDDSGAKITLPLDPPDCIEYVIKLEYGAPVGNRKLKIYPQGSNTIDGGNSVTFINPYQSLSLISRGKNWWII